MLVAVRAIAPVAGRPPNRLEATLATPCPTSSWFERCLVPAMPSATTAESSASIPARNAMVKADGITAWIFASVISGSAGIGNPAGMSGKREPIVSTGRLRAATASEAATIAIR